MLRKAPFLALIFILFTSSSQALMNFQLGEPINRLRDNSAVDIIYDPDAGIVWLATSRGMSGTTDGGVTWFTYDGSNGMNSNDIAALAYADGRLWAATAHNELFNDQLLPVGDGFNITQNHGSTFESYKPRQATFTNMLAYDLAVLDSAAWASCFAGGLIRSLDYGQTWHNIFASEEDSIDLTDNLFQRRTNLYYSVVIDTFSQDTVSVWAGSAAGIHRYIYIDKAAKLAGKRTFDLSYDGTAMWVAVEGGLSRGVTNEQAVKYRFRSWDSSDGMLSDFFTAVEARPGLVVAAAWDPDSEEGIGFNVSTDDGDSWASVEPDQAVGSGKFVSRILNVDGTVFAACSAGGLIRSTDSGANWESILPVSGDDSPDQPFNRFYSMCAEQLGGDSVALWTGTDTGLYVFSFDDLAADPYDIKHIPFDDNDSNGQHIEAVYIRSYETDEDTTKQIWVATHPVDEEIGEYRVMMSADDGISWEYSLQPTAAYDFGIYLDLLWISSEAGLLWTGLEGSSSDEFTLFDKNGHFGLDSTFTRIEPTDKDMWVATRELPIRTVGGFLFIAENVNTDPQKYDFHLLFDMDSGLSGDFVTALGIQYHNNQKTIWAATQKTETGDNGITSTTNSGADWIVRQDGVQVWNFAFDEGDVYYASSQGLFRKLDAESEFSKLSFVESDRREISDDAEFYSVRVADGVLWVGSSDGIIRQDLSGDPVIFREFRSVADAEGGKPYATPVPSSPTKGLGIVRFHYHLPEPDFVTIKVYDFAMNLVATVIDNQPREPRETSDQDDDDRWDMRNENGDFVTAGTYFFVIEKADGGKEWGKLMVLP
ncbi:MAG: hypothetical protein ABIK83_05425 [Candidatus Zixiibacteriota bacterium]